MTFSYHQKLKERLNEVIFDYITDESLSAEYLVSDIKQSVKDSFEYFDKYAKKCDTILNSITSLQSRVSDLESENVETSNTLYEIMNQIDSLKYNNNLKE